MATYLLFAMCWDRRNHSTRDDCNHEFHRKKRIALSVSCFYTVNVRRRCDNTLSERLRRTRKKEAEYVLSCRKLGKSVTSLAVEINRTEFTGCSVPVAPALSRFAARSPASVLRSFTRGNRGTVRAREQGTRLELCHRSTFPPGEKDTGTRGRGESARRKGRRETRGGILGCRHQSLVAFRQPGSTCPLRERRARTWGRGRS